MLDALLGGGDRVRIGGWRGEELFLFEQRFPHRSVPHHGHVDDSLLVTEIAILTQHADAHRGSFGDVAFGGHVILGEDVEQRGLARSHWLPQGRSDDPHRDAS